MATPHAYKTFIARANDRIIWVDGYVGGVHFTGKPDGALAIDGIMTDAEKEVARKFCQETMGR